MAEIALNGLLLDWGHSGTATYTRNLVAELPVVAPDLSFRLYTREGKETVPCVPDSRIGTIFERMNRGGGIGARLDKLAWEAVALPVAAARHESSLIHSLYFAAPPLASAPVVVTIHDLIPLVLPGYHRTRQSALYSRLMGLTVQRAAAIITVSEHSKRDIIRVLGFPEDRVYVTYEAVDGRFAHDVLPEHFAAVRERYGLPARYLLYLGGSERRKNIEVLVRAWHRVVDAMRAREMRLVLVARFPPPDPLYPDVPGLIESLGLSDDIVVIPAVDEADKPAIYHGAIGFCFPSTYEGFGLTPLEAMASGVPVLAARATSIPEVAGSGAELLPPHDVAVWAEAMLAMVDDERRRRDLISRGLNRVRAFSWKETAEQTVAVYRTVLGRCAS